MAPAQVISLARGRGGAPALRLLGDTHLARIAAKGDPRAFAVIYERHHQELFRYCRSLTGNHEDASDALQSTMAAALRALPGERREIALRPWLFRIAHNEAISQVRRRRPHAELTEDSGEPTPGPFRAVTVRERLGRLVGDLGGLPDRQRGALLMRELNGLGYGEIGTALEISPAAARQAVYEARLALTELEAGREMTCDTVRVQLSLRDARVLRGRRVSAHLRDCAECRDFNDCVALRRSALRALIPPLPAAAGTAIFAGVIGIGAAGAVSGGGPGLATGVASGVGSVFGGAVSQAASASAAFKGAAAAVAVAVVAGGSVEVARYTGKDPAPRVAIERPDHDVRSAGAAPAALASVPRPEPPFSARPDPGAPPRGQASQGRGHQPAERNFATPAPERDRAPAGGEPRGPGDQDRIDSVHSHIPAEPGPVPVEMPAAPEPQPAPAPVRAPVAQNPHAQFAAGMMGFGMQVTQNALTLAQQLLQGMVPRR